MVFRKIIRLQVVVELPINTSSLENSLFCIFYLSSFQTLTKPIIFIYHTFQLSTKNFSTLIYSIQMPKNLLLQSYHVCKIEIPLPLSNVYFHIFIFSNFSSFSIIVNPIAEIAVPIACIQTPMSAIILSFFLSTVLSAFSVSLFDILIIP